MWHGVPFACQRRPIVGVLRMCWLLPGSFDCVCCPHASVHRPSIACLAVFLEGCPPPPQCIPGGGGGGGAHWHGALGGCPRGCAQAWGLNGSGSVPRIGPRPRPPPHGVPHLQSVGAQRVTVQGPVKKQQPDGMSHEGGCARWGRVAVLWVRARRQRSPAGPRVP